MDFTGCRLPYSSGSSGSEIGWGCVSFGWVGCVRYFGIESTGASRQQAVRKFAFCPIFYRWIAVWCSWKMRQCAD